MWAAFARKHKLGMENFHLKWRIWSFWQEVTMFNVKQTYSKDKRIAPMTGLVKNRLIHIDQTVRLIQIPMVIWTEPR